MSEDQNELLNYIKKESFQKLKLLSGKSIGIKKWVMDEEKDFLFAIEADRENRDFLVEKSLELSRKCVDNTKLFDQLSKIDLLYIISKQRTLSKGEEVDFVHQCINDECSDWKEYPPEKLAELKEGEPRGEGKTLLEAKLNLSKDVETSEFDYNFVEVAEYKFFPKEISYSVNKEIEDKFLIKPEIPKLAEYNWEYILHSIDAIEVEEGKKIDNFNRDTLEIFLGKLDSTEFLDLSNKFAERLSKFNITKKVKCPLCEDENEVVYDEIFSLLVF